MKLILVTGGARSGKSDFAAELARELGGEQVTFLATATPSDEEMADRIRRHREARPGSWRTVERATGAGPALLEAPTEVVVLDCVTLLVSNAMAGVEPVTEEGCREAADREVDGILAALDERSGTLVTVTNEVGMGLVPTTPLGRWFRDAQGRANRRLAEVAERVVMLVSGIPLELKTEP